MTITMEFQEFVKGSLVPLHQARGAVAVDAAQKRALLDAFNAEHAELWESMASRKEALDRLEDKVRIDVLSLYRTIPNASKTFLPGATIREVKVYWYDAAEALVWAKQHDMALRLDDAAYKSIMANAGAPGKVSVKLTVALAQDLTPFVETQP